MTNEEIGKIIRESMARCRERGIGIKANNWGVESVGGEWRVRRDNDNNNVCPLGAVLVCGPEEVRARATMADWTSPMASSSRALDVSAEWVDNFTKIIDGVPPVYGSIDVGELAATILSEMDEYERGAK